jgi:phosphoribosylformylglycinamidine cyclo-ligase
MGFLQAQGNIEPGEMARTFNCGIGMILVVREDLVEAVTEELEAAGETVHAIGHIGPGTKGCTVTGSADTWSARSGWTSTHNG